MNKEENISNKCPICGRPTHKESKYCIFHASAEEKTEKEFKQALKEYIREIKEEDKNYDFERFVFIGDIYFKTDLNITIFKNAGFEGTIFKGDSGFMGTTFEVDAGFEGATFEGVADFKGVTFKGNTDFDEGITFKFAGYADFSGVTFMGNAYFEDATFEGVADFKGVTFKGYAYFKGSTFEGVACFEGATFEGDADFRIKYFVEDLNFLKVSLLSGKKLYLKSENNEGNVSFERAYLENTHLDIKLNKGKLIDFTDALLRNTKVKKDQIENNIFQEKKKEFPQAQQVYLLLKNNFHSIGRYNEESWAFKKERDMERKSNFHFKTLHKWLWSCFLNGIFGYGEQPGKVIVSAILVILLFASLFMIFGISNVGIEFNTSNNFLDCMYFSTITFTTLGYGDFRPLEGWGRILAGSEAFIGAFMMALFVYTFARRTGGR